MLDKDFTLKKTSLNFWSNLLVSHAMPAPLLIIVVLAKYYKAQ